MNSSGTHTGQENHANRSAAIAAEPSREKLSRTSGLAQSAGAGMSFSFQDIDRSSRTQCPGREARDYRSITRHRQTERANDLEETGERACEILNQSLADCIDLQLQCRQARWNIMMQGPRPLCRALDGICGAVSRHAEQLAERIVELNGVALGTLAVVSQRSNLNEYPPFRGQPLIDIDTVGSALDVISISLAHEVGLLIELDDEDSAHILSDLARTAEHYLAYLEAHWRV